MNQQFPQEDSSESIEGTDAHWVAWEILYQKEISSGMTAPKGSIVTDEMMEGGELLVETVHNLFPKHSFTASLHIERTLPVPFGQKNFGTPDCWGITDDRKNIRIVDYKFGHRFVDEWWNEQGLCYLAAILEFLKIEGNLDPYITVSFTVVQPRCYHRGASVRTHIFKLSEARPYFNQLSTAAELTMMQNPTATTNDHCGDCPGRHGCLALQQAAYDAAEFSNARTPLFLSPVAAALELRLLERAQQRLEARVEGLKELTITNIRRGERIPYYRVEQGYGRRIWNVPESQVISLGSLYGKDLSKPGIMTPTQAKSAGVDESVIKAYSFTPTTSFKLVPENPTDAAKVFGNPQEG